MGRSSPAPIAGAVAATVVLSSLTGCGDHGTGGCRLRSVDKSSYVAKNDAVFRRVPVYPGSKLVTSYSFGQAAPNPCLPRENGPPYDHFITERAYTKPTGIARGKIVRFYRDMLPPEWRLAGYSVTDPPVDSAFRRGRALLYVFEPRGEGAWLIHVDHDAYRRR